MSKFLQLEMLKTEVSPCMQMEFTQFSLIYINQITISK